jgi:hypothetical protein
MPSRYGQSPVSGFLELGLRLALPQKKLFGVEKSMGFAIENWDSTK